MSGEDLRPMPIHVRRYRAETEASYLNRLFDAHDLPERYRQAHIRNLRARIHPGQELADVLGGAPARPHRSDLAAHITACGKCAGTTDDRWVCTRCTAGAVVPQDPRVGPNVCRRHRRWVAPGTTSPQQTAVSYPVIRADRHWQQLLHHGAATILHGVELDQLVDEWGQLNDVPCNAPDRFVLWVRLWRRITAPVTFELLTNPWQPYKSRYATLRTIVDTVVGPATENAGLQDGLWAMLRSTALLRRTDLPDCDVNLDEPHHVVHAPDAPVAAVGPLPPIAHYYRPAVTSRANRWEDLNQKHTLQRSTAGVRWAITRGATTQLVVACPLGHRLTRSANATAHVNSKERFACPYCSGRRALAGFRSLADTAIQLSVRWHPTKNGDLTTAEVPPYSGRVVWWLCANGHEFDNPIVNVVTNRGGCPVCRNYRIRAGVNDLATLSPRIAAEWHPNRNGDRTPANTGAGTAAVVWWQCASGHEWKWSVIGRRTTGCPDCRAQRAAANTLSVRRPDLARQWHPDRNGTRTADATTCGSGRLVWWFCDLGHAYEQSPARRTTGAGCHYCRNKKVLPGFNDAFTRRPELMADWDFDANTNFNPRQQLPGVNKHWWRCAFGHQQYQTIPNRYITGGCTRCPARLRVAAPMRWTIREGADRADGLMR